MQSQKCVYAAQKIKRLWAFCQECKQAGIPAPDTGRRFLTIRTDANTLIGWVYHHDHNFCRRFDRLWVAGREVERQEKRAARTARRAVSR
jgi:hypothetical protein